MDGRPQAGPGGSEARWGGIGLGVLLVLALAAPLLAPYPPERQSPDIPGARYLPPLTRLREIRLPEGRRVVATRVRATPAGTEYFRAGEWSLLPAAAAGAAGPARWHLLGTDGFGRDLLSRILFGARISLGVGLLAVLLAATLGTLAGATAGLAGGAVDSLIMRLVDAALSVPRLFVILAVVALLRPSLALIVILLGGTGWMDTARLVRGQILSLKERDFVQAARALGKRPAGLLLRHLLPNSAAPIAVDAALGVGNAILAEAALSYLGLGVPPPAPSWGNLVGTGRAVLLDAWWISTFPGLAIVLTVLCLNLLGEGLRQAWTPHPTGDRC